MGKNTPLAVGVEGDELVIRIGVDTLAYAALNSDAFNVFSHVAKDYVLAFKIGNNHEFAAAVARELKQDVGYGFDDDSRIALLMDKCFEKVIENADGSTEEVEIPEPVEEDED